MDIGAFRSQARGTVRKTLEGYSAFFPTILPRSIDYQEATVHKLNDAVAAIHRLGGASRLLPTADLLSLPYVRLEAVLSSRIEGTQTSVHDLLRFEADPQAQPDRDVREVVNYTAALRRGFARLRDLPLSLRLIREMHAVLFEGVPGAQSPGQFRTSQNWIGPPGSTLDTATFIPPPPEELGPLLSDLEAFLHERERPALMSLAMAHYQFEVIHPFLDGNGRVGRLLIPLVLAERQILSSPLLALSIYFDQHRSEYFDLLMSVSTTGEFDPWLQFFFDGVREQATAAEERTVRLVDLQKELHASLLAAKVSNASLRLADHLLSNPFLTARRARQVLNVTPPTAHAAIAKLEELQILEEITGQARNRVYLARGILDAVYGTRPNQGTTGLDVTTTPARP
ncbi:MAG: Fic family protein [Actinomycetota bacterium]